MLLYNFEFIYSFFLPVPELSPTQAKACKCDQICAVDNSNNTRGPTCSCLPGYQLCSDNITCVDINECLVQRGGCSHGCRNTVGSYICTCPLYHRLASDRRTCITNTATSNRPIDPSPAYPPVYRRSYPLPLLEPHFVFLLPTSQTICYSIKGVSNQVFNLINYSYLQINALLVTDQYLPGVNRISALGVVLQSTPAKHSTIAFIANNQTVTVTRKESPGSNLLSVTTFEAASVQRITLAHGKLVHSENTAPTYQPTVHVSLLDMQIEFTVSFSTQHLHISWMSIGQLTGTIYGLIGQFLQHGAEVDEKRMMLIVPHLEPIPVKQHSFTKRRSMKSDECWAVVNTGKHGLKLTNGTYQNYIMSGLLSTEISPTRDN